MHIPILVEPREGGGFRAKAGDPYNLCAEGTSAAEAMKHLGAQFDALMAQGRQITVLTIANGKTVVPAEPTLHFEPLPDDDWFFQGLHEAIAENRRLEDEAEQRRSDDGAAR
jgi:hypothetical protein